MSAKWHAHTGTRVSINLTRKVCIENVSWAHAYETCNKTSSKAIVGKISCTSSYFGLIRSVHRRNNSNKETLIYIPYTSYHLDPSVYNPCCPQDNIMWVDALSYPVNNNQYLLIFQWSPCQCLTSLTVHTRLCTPVELIWIWYESTSIRVKERPNITRS